MIRVDSAPDGRARYIAFDARDVAPPLVLVRTFNDEEREAA